MRPKRLWRETPPGATPSHEELGVSTATTELGLPEIKPEDVQYFGKLADESVVEEDLSKH